MALELNGTTGVSLVQDGVVSTDDIAANAVTAAKLASTLDLTGKTVTLPAGVGGKVLQIQTAFKSSVSSTTSTSYTDAGLNVAITPSSTSSKILVLCDAKFGGASGNLWFVQITRNGTPIGNGDAAGGRQLGLMEWDGTNNTVMMITAGMCYLDSPASTSAVTYRVQFKGYAGNTVFLNRTGSDRDPNDVRTGSSITVMEIAA